MGRTVIPWMIMGVVMSLGINGGEKVTAVAGQPFDLSLNQKADLKDSPIMVQFKRVADDSRCPKGVQCIWAGQVVAVLDINGEEVQLTLPGGRGDALASSEKNGYRVQLQAVHPYPVDGVEQDPSAYTATLSISKL